MLARSAASVSALAACLALPAEVELALGVEAEDPLAVGAGEELSCGRVRRRCRGGCGLERGCRGEEPEEEELERSKR